MFDNEYIGKEFKRNLALITNDDFNSEKYVTFEDVLKAHFLVIDFFSSSIENITYGVKDFTLLGSTLGRQIAGYGSYQRWKKSEEICATLFYGLIKNHAFHDANKRTALLTLFYHLLKFGKTINTTQKEFETLALCVASDSLNEYNAFNGKYFQNLHDKEIHFIAEFIRRNTRDIDKRYYPVTYQEFNRLLNVYGFHIEIASGGAYVDIVGNETEKKFFGLIEKKYKKRYIQVGFPGWKSQINSRAVKEILKATGLTAENGIDSKVFYKGAEPLTALIDQYKGPLVRLKDK